MLICIKWIVFSLSLIHCIRLKEGNQLKIVINHPTFQSDPLGAIYQHLKSTQPPTEEKPKRKENKDGKKKKVKRKKSKSSGALQPMEAWSDNYCSFLTSYILLHNLGYTKCCSLWHFLLWKLLFMSIQGSLVL